MELWVTQHIWYLHLGVFLNQQFRLGRFRSQLCGKDRSRDATILPLRSLFQDVIPKLEKMALKYIKVSLKGID